jgi:hypothetical protein
MEGNLEASVMDLEVSVMEGDSVEVILSEGRPMAVAWEVDRGVSAIEGNKGEGALLEGRPMAVV